MFDYDAKELNELYEISSDRLSDARNAITNGIAEIKQSVQNGFSHFEITIETAEKAFTIASNRFEDASLPLPTDETEMRAVLAGLTTIFAAYAEDYVNEGNMELAIKNLCNATKFLAKFTQQTVFDLE